MHSTRAIVVYYSAVARQIEDHVHNTDAYIVAGVESLKDANKLQKKIRKKKLALIGFATLAVAGVALGAGVPFI